MTPVRIVIGRPLRQILHTVSGTLLVDVDDCQKMRAVECVRFANTTLPTTKATTTTLLLPIRTFWTKYWSVIRLRFLKRPYLMHRHHHRSSQRQLQQSPRMTCSSTLYVGVHYFEVVQYYSVVQCSTVAHNTNNCDQTKHETVKMPRILTHQKPYGQNSRPKAKLQENPPSG
jgi:hypothetical protein